MTNQEVLERAIQKAVDSGFGSDLIDEKSQYINKEGIVKHFISTLDDYGIEGLIYNHDFAKALWGEELETFTLSFKIEGTKAPDIPHYKWERHLQNMVIAPDPFKYLEEHLDG
jgi:hypothetical protein